MSIKTKPKSQKVDLIISKKTKEENKRIREILKANNLQPEANGFGDYKSLLKRTNSPTLSLDFKSKDIAESIASVLHKKYGYNSTISDKMVEVALIKTDTKTNVASGLKKIPVTKKIAGKKSVEIITPPASQLKIDLLGGTFAKMREDKQVEDDNKLNELRSRAKRIIGLIRHKFNITNVRGDKQQGYNSGRIRDPKTKGYWMAFASENLAAQVTSFLEGENYIVNRTGREITVDIIKTPDEVKFKRHEETEHERNQVNLVEKQADLLGELKSALDVARTAHLTPAQIGARIWEYMANNNYYFVDGSKKITVKELCEGVSIVGGMDKELFVNIVVPDSLKINL